VHPLARDVPRPPARERRHLEPCAGVQAFVVAEAKPSGPREAWRIVCGVAVFDEEVFDG
jgi:hypothetical protein